MAGLAPVILLAICALTASAGGDPPVAPVVRNGFSRLTGYEELKGFLGELPERSMTVRQIAITSRGRTVWAVHFVRERQTPGLRVLLFAQQHGDEPSGKEAMTLLLERIAAGDMDRHLDSTDLVVVPQMNPDGAELRQRRTATGIDLNRNHVLLSSPEVRGLHDLFHDWQPHVTLDVHEYGAYSSAWTDSGFVKAADVQLGMLTNLNTAPAIRSIQHEGVAPFVQSRMHREGYSFHEYIVGSPSDRIRHSTTEINDGRQSFGILGALSFIQEGRKGRSLEGGLERRTRSQCAAVEALLEYCALNAGIIRREVDSGRSALQKGAGASIVVRMDHGPGGASLTIPVRMLGADGPERDAVWTVRPYHDRVLPLRAVTLPAAYAIPAAESSAVSLLLRHHVSVETLRTETIAHAERAIIDSVFPAVIEEDSLSLLAVRWETVQATLPPGSFLVSTAQAQSQLIGILLEPESFWGLAKYDSFAHLRTNPGFPFLRIFR